ncbi:hypothetical protein [Alienimonas californiensis]|uniref:Uncharacterized protein n=1 Tax=Alienimonas californiensis TaxID=2527989 RepID=A0A517PBJ5_9PLAN|nr:hypothetical protein [Alienimonas californiensis]QDT16747.1 hypothetical protein CA12_28540 [Alienimonas californiensis]
MRKSRSPRRSAPKGPHAELAERVGATLLTLHGSQSAAARTWGVPQPRISDALDGRTPPAVWLLERLAAEGADVTTLLTGRPAPVAAVPLLDGFLAGRSAGATVLGVHHVPAEFVAVGTYAVRLDRTLAEATLGGTAANRPREGDTVVVVTDVETVAGLIPRAWGFGARRSRKRIPLPPSVVLLDGVPTLSLAHRVRLAGRPDGASLRLPVTTDPPAIAAGLPESAAGALDAVGFVVLRTGPLSP